MPKNTHNTIEIETVHRFITQELEGVVPLNSWGETAYFYNPNNVLKRGTYFATIKQKDGANDRASNLDRDGIWRLNMGVQKSTFQEMFVATPKRPAKGQSIEGPWDFSKSDIITPHPIYGWMSWLAVSAPSVATFQMCKPLIIDAHKRAIEMFLKRTKKPAIE